MKMKQELKEFVEAVRSGKKDEARKLLKSILRKKVVDKMESVKNK